MKSIQIGKSTIGDKFPCYCIAEIGSMFKTFDEAKLLIDNAIAIGLDAIKFQTYDAETISIKDNKFDMEVTGNISQYDFFKQFEPSKNIQKQIVQYANQKNITIFSAPSHEQDLDLLEELDLPIYKIGSDLACHTPILKKIAKFKKPIILSTGMCTMDEVRNSVNSIFDEGNDQIILLHCVSDYPAKPEESNLNVISEMKKEFNLPVGFSDHCVGTDISFASVVMGANVIERHFKNNLTTTYPDDIHALTKEQYKKLINSIRVFEKSRGTGKKIPSLSEQKNLLTNRVSLIIMENLTAGTILTSDVIDIRRPGSGISPQFYDSVLGKTINQDIKKFSPLTFDMIEDFKM